MNMQLLLRTPEASAELRRELQQLSDCDDCELLVVEMRKAFTLTAENVLRMAVIVRRLEELDYDLTQIKISFLTDLRRIAHGQVLPELFANVGVRRELFRHASLLPMPDQELVANDHPIPCAVAGADKRMVRPSEMGAATIKQVFARDHIRTISEQKCYLDELEKKRLGNLALKGEMEVVRVNRKRHGIHIGNVFLSASQLATYLAELQR